MADATKIKDDRDMLRKKIHSNYDNPPDKSFLKGGIKLYEECLPEFEIDGLKKLLEDNEAVCKAATENVAGSVQKIKDDYT